MVALVKVTEGWRKKGAGKRLPNAVVPRDLGAVRGESQVRIRPKISGDLLRARFIDIQFSSKQFGIGHFEPLSQLLPGEYGGSLRQSADPQAVNERRRQHEPSKSSQQISIYPALGWIPGYLSASQDIFWTCPSSFDHLAIQPHENA
jgi:hypothetical protein